MKYTRLPFALLLLLALHSCKESSPAKPDEPLFSVSLSVVSVLSNEVWLKLSFADSSGQPRDFRILRNDSVLIRGSLFGKDTLIANFANTSLMYLANAHLNK